MTDPVHMPRAVLVTGAGGYIGSQLIRALATQKNPPQTIVAADVRETSLDKRFENVHYMTTDIRSPDLAANFEKFRVDTVVHLASIVTPGKRSNREFEYSVDVVGTENVVRACLSAGVDKLIVTSSGAAYGYYPDNPQWLRETDRLRGNPEFAYSDHKRLVEEMLARYRYEHPELKQLIFRPGTILGTTADNQITALFQKPYILGIKGAASPFVFIWDEDVINCLLRGIEKGITGIFNLAGDGVLTMREIAAFLKKPYIALPVRLVRAALLVLKRLGLTRYGPEQVDFLRYRPVLSNKKVKEVFGYVPQKTTRQVFEYFLNAQGMNSLS